MRLPALLLAALALPAAAGERTGADVYAATCSACHASGALGAPKFADRARWKKLLREGLDDLVPSALAGVRKIPAKGGDPQLSDGEVARAVIFMANAGGGRYAEPTPADLRRWRRQADSRRKH